MTGDGRAEQEKNREKLSFEGKKRINGENRCKHDRDYGYVPFWVEHSIMCRVFSILLYLGILYVPDDFFKERTYDRNTVFMISALTLHIHVCKRQTI